MGPDQRVPAEVEEDAAAPKNSVVEPRPEGGPPDSEPSTLHVPQADSGRLTRHQYGRRIGPGSRVREPKAGGQQGGCLGKR